MDCGPAGLTCLLEGFHVAVSYARLRDACQTDVDGTSIDTLETVANALGLRAQQVLIPVEHMLLDPANLPALAVVRHPDGQNHFVVVWRRVGPWLQIMDPAAGRQWLRADAFAEQVVNHEISVPAVEWRGWVESDEFLVPLRRRLRSLGVSARDTAAHIDSASADPGWFTFGALDACVRMVAAIVAAKGLRPGAETARLLAALFQTTCNSPLDIFTLVSPSYWSVAPDPATVDAASQRLLARGAVLLRVDGPGAAPASEHGAGTPLLADSPELAAASRELRHRPASEVWKFLREDGLLEPMALIGAALLAACVTTVEALLMRGIFDIGALLPLASHRLAAVVGFIAFMVVTIGFRAPLTTQSLRMGRRLDARLRMALLRKLPALSDRYFQSRPISDLAERAHSIHLLRAVPGMALHFVQTFFEVLLTLAAIVIIDTPSLGIALLLVAAAALTSALTQPMVNERDLRMRTHAAALGRFYLDALLGLTAIRAHQADKAVRHQHQSLLVEWMRSSLRLIRASLAITTVQAVVCTGLPALLLVRHFARSGGVTGADLLLVYWGLKLPALVSTLVSLAHQYPMQRTITLRLLEPLSAPELVASLTEPDVSRRSTSSIPSPRAFGHGVAISLTSGTVVAAGHVILDNVSLEIAPGEHVAIVGRSGAGKSTLFGLLLGWHRLAKGQLHVDGQTLNAETLAILRQRTAWVDPGVQLWNRTLLDNVTYSSPRADGARAAAALQAATLRDLVARLPQGLQTYLGEGGALLSGGEGQRVRLARALAQPDVALALLDEPFRGLDRVQRGRLLGEARAHWSDATLLCVTHDVAETMTFDRVLIVSDGRIVEDGVPRHLAARRSNYRALLEAEWRVREQLWQSDVWRRLHVADGQVHEDEDFRAHAAPVMFR